ncbi:O-antigen ligase family protein [Bradyrhizobium prioriisuperbiae]|uniref:O-antigen ligase family protein n=1 Tax=Bradyrhizobium prioriisuperbiae TaxID=2854389 RepID=UPI00389940B8
MSEGLAQHQVARDCPVPGTRGPVARLVAACRDPAVRMRNADVLAAAIAATLPWSTTAPAVFTVLWLIALALAVDLRGLLRSLARPACALPLAFFVLAVVGTLWSDSSWAARLHGINPVSKLLAIPILLYHFERSERGLWVLKAFLVSCALLMVLSWIVLVAPGLKVTATTNPGVPVKNYIDQSQEFTLCMFALASPALALFRQRRFAWAAACVALMLGFFANMMFVVSARTALVYIPVLLVLFAVLHLSARASLILLAATVAAAVLVGLTSPYLRDRIANVAVEYQGYQSNAVTSTAQRLEYWNKSLKFIGQAPVFGNGTGSTKQLFEREAVGQTGLLAEVIGNPHNQTLNVAVQWGLVGCLVLYAMWIVHLMLFRGVVGLATWVGLTVVVQNVVSSLLNSHLFDFHEGWMYVLGVGVAGGMALRERAAKQGAAP